MIKISDYPEVIKRIGLDKLNSTQREAHEFIAEGSENFTNMGQMAELMAADADIRETTEMYLAQLEKLDKQAEPEPKPEPEKEPAPKPKKEPKPKAAAKPRAKKAKAPKAEPEPKQEPTTTKLEKIPAAVAFLNRWRKMNGKTIALRNRKGTKGANIVSFFNSLQKAIKEKVIGKADKYASEIVQMQKELVKLVNSSAGYGKVKIEVKNFDHLLEITNSYAIKTITSLAKRFIAIQGKEGVKKEAAQFIKVLNTNINAGMVTKDDVSEMSQAVNAYIDGKTDIIEVSEATLNGLHGLAGIPISMKEQFKQAGARAAKKRKHIKKQRRTTSKKALAGNSANITFDGKEVTYQIDKGGMNIEFTGHLETYNSGRSKELKFVPDWFRDNETEPHYNEHWEAIEDEIIAAYRAQKKSTSKKALAGADTPAPAVIETEHVAEPTPEPVKPKIDPQKLPNVISSETLRDLRFTKAGYTGKWLKLIGDPVEPYALMIYANPGKGKSSLAIELARDLSKDLNKKVLYISKDEGNNSYTIQEKFDRLGAWNPNIHISNGFIPKDLSEYDYVVFDLMNDFKFKYDDFKFNYIEKYRSKNVSFISIFKTTADGNFRGDSDWENMFDVSININDEGYAQATKNRFGAFGVIKFLETSNEKIYKFTTLQEAERFKNRMLTKDQVTLVIVNGTDGRYWCVSPQYASVLKEQGFTIHGDLAPATAAPLNGTGERRIKTNLPEAITSISQAKQFLRELDDNDESYDPTTDANDLMGQPFTTAEANHLNKLMQDIYSLPGNFDAYEFIAGLRD